MLLLLLILNSVCLQCQSIPLQDHKTRLRCKPKRSDVASNTQHVAKLIERMLLAYLSIICVYYDNSKKKTMEIIPNNNNKKKQGIEKITKKCNKQALTLFNQYKHYR